MNWNWQKKNWPNFSFEPSKLDAYESKFVYQTGVFLGVLKHLNENEKEKLRIELISEEAYKTSEIEGEMLNRESIQSSIRKNFGLSTDKTKISPTEHGIAEMMVDLYNNFSKPLSHTILCNWNSLILNGTRTNKIKYRDNDDNEPMQVISGPIHNPKVHFEAPPANQLETEMNNFIKWFNSTDPSNNKALTPLIRAGIAHLYFVFIHPFADGNGRIARALCEKALSQNLQYPSLISLSLVIEKHKKQYYAALDFSNKDLEITQWLIYFSKTILEALEYSQKVIEFSIKKAQFYEKYKTELNNREEKVIARIFAEGINGFTGGLSAENYISITGTSRATATRDLQDLVEKGILIKEGQLKSTRYYLNL